MKENMSNTITDAEIEKKVEDAYKTIVETLTLNNIYPEVAILAMTNLIHSLIGEPGEYAKYLKSCKKAFLKPCTTP